MIGKFPDYCYKQLHNLHTIKIHAYLMTVMTLDKLMDKQTDENNEKQKFMFHMAQRLLNKLSGYPNFKTA